MRFTQRTSPITFVNACVLDANGVAASSVRVHAGRIARLDARPESNDCVVDLGGAIVAPGLINAHDHLELNNFPRLKWRDRYDNAREWIADFQPRFDSDPSLSIPRAVPLADRLLIGAMKNMLSGVTIVCHHNPLYPAARRLPVRVASRYRFSHSLLIDGEEAVAREHRRTPEGSPWIIHLAEGTDAEAAAELGRLERLGCLTRNTIVVHGVGLTPKDRRRLIERGGGLVWCPSSNLFTLGSTTDVRELSRAGLATLGSDSRLSGERDLLAEMKVALDTGQVDARAIFHMVTVDAAALMRLAHAGRLTIGGPADLIVLPDRAGDPYRSVIDADRSTLRLVMIDGRPVVGDPDMRAVFDATRTPAVPVRLDRREKWLAGSIADRLHRSRIGEPGLEIAQRDWDTDERR